MLGAVREAVVLTDADLDNGPRFLFVNEAFERMTGYEASEVIGETPRILQGPGTDRATRDRLRRDLDTTGRFEGTVINYRKDTTPYHVRWYIETITDAAGKPEYFVGVQQDVSSLLASEEALNSTLCALEASPVGLFFVDSRGVVIRSNPAAHRLFGLEANTLPGKTFEEVLDIGVFRERQGDTVLTSIRTEGMDPDRNLQLERIGNSYDDTFWTVTDTTERRRLDALASAVNVVQQTGYVFAGIRHELGNPINSIKTAVTVLTKHHDRFDAKKRSEYYDRILAELDRVEFLLSSLRNYNAYESQSLGRFDVVEQITAFVRVAGCDVPDNVAVSWSPAKEPVIVRGDPRGLYQVLLNLFKNAGDALNGVARGAITLEVTQTSRIANIIVRDNGCGMSPSQLESVGRPFATTKPHGTGLGICVSQRILTRMDGTMEFSSTPGEGTTVTVQLPLDGRE